MSEKNLKRNFTFLPREKRFLSYLNLGHEIGIAQKRRGFGFLYSSQRFKIRIFSFHSSKNFSLLKDFRNLRN
ncbi:hypothetical protein CH380_07680 [Leptospira adleri]|uniref:Uncharacterized protein n=1 Tax=Leptospira adleri TaxID=2023186 RepID=A0A2M9YQS2_9LEPT|nr:hypothetical protein CH380_07680 [Leptospira adleri]PJZ63108.1 hypothetical protein CH376_04450 [Leptospira adleri]